jgi:hypothetical protein
MSNPKSVSVSITEDANGIRVWCASFHIKGSIPKKDGKIDETARLKKQKQIEKILEQVVFPDE